MGAAVVGVFSKLKMLTRSEDQATLKTSSSGQAKLHGIITAISGAVYPALALQSGASAVLDRYIRLAVVAVTAQATRTKRPARISQLLARRNQLATLGRSSRGRHLQLRVNA